MIPLPTLILPAFLMSSRSAAARVSSIGRVTSVITDSRTSHRPSLCIALLLPTRGSGTCGAARGGRVRPAEGQPRYWDKEGRGGPARTHGSTPARRGDWQDWLRERNALGAHVDDSTCRRARLMLGTRLVACQGGLRGDGPVS